MLDIESPAEYDEVITGMEFHSHMPYASNTYKNNDEIRIPISQQDIITAPFESTLHISGTVTCTKTAGNATATVKLVNNAMAFLFEDIRYEIGGVEVDRVKNLGITTTIKNLLSARKEDEHNLKNACWLGVKNTFDTSPFTFSVPLRLLMGFAEDYRRIVVNVKQELILLRSATDNNAVISADGDNLDLTITKLYWRVPHITVTDKYKLKLLKMVEKDTPLHVPFRSWELHEFPTLPQTKNHSWTVKVTTQVEKPRYVVLAFQTDRKNKLAKNAGEFDHCGIQNVKLYLNSQYYPYTNVNGDYCIFYEMFSNFQRSYYQGKPNSCTVDFTEFKTNAPLFVIDCSRQNDAIKSGPVDVRIEFDSSDNIAANTTAYCLLLHDSHMMYTLLTGSVKKVM